MTDADRIRKWVQEVRGRCGRITPPFEYRNPANRTEYDHIFNIHARSDLPRAMDVIEAVIRECVSLSHSQAVYDRSPIHEYHSDCEQSEGERKAGKRILAAMARAMEGD